MRSAKVPLSRVAADELQLVRTVEHGLPFDAGRESCAAAATQSGFGDLRDHVRGSERQGRAEPRQSAVLQIVLRRQGVGHTDSGEGDAGLACQPGQFVHDAEPQRVVGSVEHAGSEEARHVSGGHRSVADATIRGHHLDQRLQPEHAARSVACHVDVKVHVDGRQL
jgi:hypothetical protein